MFAEFKHTMRRLRGQMIGWGIGLALYALMMVYFYGSVANMENIQEFLKSYPEEMLGFFRGMMEMNTPRGYLDTYYYSMMSIIVGIFAVGAGAGLLVGDEEKGLLDLVLAHPVSRTALFWGRLLGFAAATAVILLAGWLGWLMPSGIELSPIEFLLPCLALFAVLVLFGTLALLLSLLLPASRAGSMLSGALLVGNYLVLGLSEANKSLQTVVRYTPLYYYQGGYAVTGINWAWLGGLLGASLILALLAWWRFQRRDIRVGGEQGWQLPGWRILRRRLAAAR